MTEYQTRALVRRIPRSYVSYYASRNITVSARLAETQHQEYVGALEASGLKVSFVEPDESLPDCVFIEDTAVVWKTHALITRMYQDREGEQTAVQEILQHSHSIVEAPTSAKLEGGDVLHIGDTTYVGISERTDKAGVESLKSFLSQFKRKVISVPVNNCLHLKTGLTYIGNGTLVSVPGLFDMQLFEVDDVIYTTNGEHGAANCLRIRDDLLIANGYKQTTQSLRHFAEKNLVNIRPINISEFEKGDGSLTCLSIIW